MGPDRLVQSGRDQGSGRPAVLVRISRRRPGRLAGVPRGGRADPPRPVGGVRHVQPRAWRHGSELRPVRPGSHLRIAVAQPLQLPGRGRLRARAPARPDLASAGFDGPGGGRDLGSARAPPQPGWSVDLPLAGQSRFGGRGPDAAPGRPAGDDRAPGHRLQGPAGRPDHPARQPGGRGLPAAAGDPARGRPGHHARRQQHRHRGVPPRQADDRPAALLGPGRQRPAHRRDRVRPPPGDL